MELKPRKVGRFKITSHKKKSARFFRNGKVVEVRSDEEGFEGAWYTAVIKDYLGDGKYLVEYLTLMTDDETAPLKEEARAEDIRPYPPQPPQVPFRPLDKVDVWYNDGWWTGVISKVLSRSTFMVYFSTTNEELVFKEPYLRIHQDWIYRKWVVSSPVWTIGLHSVSSRMFEFLLSALFPNIQQWLKFWVMDIYWISLSMWFIYRRTDVVLYLLFFTVNWKIIWCTTQMTEWLCLIVILFLITGHFESPKTLPWQLRVEDGF